MNFSRALVPWRWTARTGAEVARKALASALTLLADWEADHDLRRRSGIDIRGGARGKRFHGAKNRVFPMVVRTPDGETPVIVKRPPVRIVQVRNLRSLVTEVRVLQSLSGGGCIGITVPTVLGVGLGRLLGGSVLVLDELPGETITRTDWYDREALDVIADAYFRIHSAYEVTAAEVDPGHPVMELSARLFESLPPAVKADIQAAGGMVPGLVHGDPHPGNWLWVQPERSVNLVDWGDAHLGWPAVEIARCAMRIAEHAGEEAGLFLLERYLHRGMRMPDEILGAGHLIAQRWPRGDDEALAGYVQIDESCLRARRESYLRAILDIARPAEWGDL